MTPEFFVINIRLATGWVTDFANYEMAPLASFLIGPGGVPVLTYTDWPSFSPNPDPNTWQIAVPIEDIERDQNDCFAYAIRIRAVRRNFLGGILAGSQRTLWTYNAEYNDPNSEDFAPSPYLTPSCVNYSYLPPVYENHSLYPCSDSSSTCLDLVPDVPFGASSISYLWNTGATDSMIQACSPPGQYSYSVTVSSFCPAFIQETYYYVYIAEPAPEVPDTTNAFCYGVKGNNFCGVPYLGNPCNNPQAGKGKWHIWIGDGQPVTVSTCQNSYFDTQISVFTDPDGNPTCIGSNDNANCGNNPLGSELTWNSVFGVAYYIFVEGVGLAEGGYILEIFSPLPANDNVCDATPLEAGIASPFDNYCASLEANEPLAPSGPCNSQLAWCNQSQDNSVWFTFIAPPSGCVGLSVSDVSAPHAPNFKIAVWDGAACSDFSDFHLLAANDDPTGTPFIPEITCLVPGKTYFVQVDGYDEFQGIGTILLTECGSPPLHVAFSTEPAATAQGLSICLGQEVAFRDSSSGVLSGLWNFGDGFVSTAISPTHAYQLPGTYTAQLLATGTCGSQQTQTVEIVVGQDPGPEIFCPAIVCEGDTVSYHTNALCSDFVWSVGGGQIVSLPINNDTIRVVWGSGTNGIGTISLSVPNCSGLCGMPNLKTVPIVPTVVSISGPLSVGAGNVSQYTAPFIPGTNYQWSCDQCAAISSQGGHEVEILWEQNAVGAANVQVTMTNSLANCEGEGLLPVQILQRFQVTGPGLACASIPDSLHPFTAQRSVDAQAVPCDWSVTTPAATVLPNLATNSSTFVYDFPDGPGQYTLTATPSSGTYFNSTSVVFVNVEAIPAPAATILGDSLICPPQSSEYTASNSNLGLHWSVQGGQIADSLGLQAEVDWDSIGPYSISVVRYSPLNACPSPPTTLQVAPYTVPSVPQVSGPRAACLGSTSTFSFVPESLPGISYVWVLTPASAGNVTQSYAGDSLFVEWAGSQADTAQISLFVSLCDSQATSIDVALIAPPPVQITLPDSVCTGAASLYSGSNANNWLWDFGDGGSSTQQVATHTYVASGTYSVNLTVSDSIGCSSLLSEAVTVTDRPIDPLINGTSYFCGENTATYSFSQAISPTAQYSWQVLPDSAGNIVSISEDSVTVHWNAFAETQHAVVQLTVTSACLNLDVQFPVTIHPQANAGFALPISTCAGANVIFSAAPAASWAWDFGDGQQASLQATSHAFAMEGQYPVMLSLIDTNGCASVFSDTIAVLPIPHSTTISGSLTICGDSISEYVLADTIPAGIIYEWLISPASAGTILGYDNHSLHVHWKESSSTLVAQISVSLLSACVDTQSTLSVAINPPAIATISSNSFGCAVTPFQFIGGAGAAWNWDFGDGGSDTQQSPTHTFGSPGTYSVTLHMTDVQGCEAVTSKSLSVDPSPLAQQLDGQDSLCGGGLATYSLAQATIPGAIDQWSILPSGAGVILPTNTDSTISVQWADPLETINAQVRLKVTSTCGIAEESFPVWLFPSANASIQAPGIACADASVAFSSPPGTAWAWDFGDGTTASVQAPTHAYDLAGSYPIHLDLMDGNGCTATAEDTIEVFPVPVLPVITGPDQACAGNNSIFSFSQALVDGGSYSWSLVPGSAGVNNGGGPGSASFQWGIVAASTSALVVLDVHSTCKDTSVNFPLTIHPLPEAGMGFPSQACVGEIVPFTGASAQVTNWDFGDNSVSALQNPVHAFQAPGYFEIQLEVSENGCSAASQGYIELLAAPSEPILQGQSQVCTESVTRYAVQNPATSGVTYLWTLQPSTAGTILTSPTGNAIDVQWSTTGPATLSLALQSYCRDTIIEFPVMVLQRPVANIGLISPVCEGSPAQFSGPPAHSWNWAFSRTEYSSLQNPAFVFNKLGQHVVSLVVANLSGCRDTAYTAVMVYPSPIARIYTDCAPDCDRQRFCIGTTDSISLFALNGLGYQFEWLPSIPSTTDTAEVHGAGTYQLQVTNVFGCIAYDDITLIGDSCLQDSCIPEAHSISFSSDYNEPTCTGFDFEFALSPNAVFEVFNFGDGQATTQFNPFHDYEEAGAYCPVLVARVPEANSLGDSCTVKFCSAVEPPLTADFYVDSTCVANGWALNLSDYSNYFQGNVIDSWSWYSDGAQTPFATGPYPSHVFSSGAHTITLSISSSATGATCNTTKAFDFPAPPIADFAFQSPVCANTDVTFTNQSSLGVVDGSWSFMNGSVVNTDLLQNTFAFPFPGIFSNGLSVVDTNGCVDSVSRPITVLANPSGVIMASGPTTFCNGDSVVLQAPSGISYIWSNGAVSQNITVKHDGEFQVTILHATGCTFSTPSVEVKVRPFPAFPILGNQFYCQGAWLNLHTTSGGYNYAWEFDDLPINGSFTGIGSNSSALQFMIHSESQTGNYRVAVSDTIGICSLVSAPVFVTMDSLPGNPLIAISGPSNLCQGSQVVLTAPAGQSYAWSDGSSSQTTIATQAGIYDVSVTTANGCPISPPSIQIHVAPLPQATILGRVDYCTGDSLQLRTVDGPWDFQWEFDAPPIDNIFAPVGTHAATLSLALPNTAFSGNYRVKVTDTASGCFAFSPMQMVTVTDLAPVPSITPSGPLSFCDGDTVLLSAFGTGPFLWQNGDTTATIHVTASGSYSVKTRGGGACSSESDPITLIKNPLPEATISGATTYCTGAVLNLRTSAGPYAFQWQHEVGSGNFLNLGSNSANFVQPITSASDAGTYRVIVTDTVSGCQSVSTDFLVLVDSTPPVPTISLSGPSTFCVGDSITLTASGTGNLVWNTGATTQQVTVTQNGIYNVAAIGQGICRSTSSSITVVAQAAPATGISGQTDYCEGQLLVLETISGPYTYLWEFDALPIDGNYAPVGTNSFMLQMPVFAGQTGNYRVTATAPSTGCQSVSGTRSVSVSPVVPVPVVTASGPLTICEGQSVLLGSSPANTYLWSNGATTQDILVTESGIYSVTVGNTAACYAKSAKTSILVNPQPPAMITGNGIYCQGGNLILSTASGPYTYQWEHDALPIEGNYDPVGSNIASLQLPLTTNLLEGNYRVVVTNIFSACTNTSPDFAVIIHPAPETTEILASGPYSFCHGDSLTLTAPTGEGYLWSSGDSTNTITISEGGAFSVTVTTSEGCQYNIPEVVVTDNPLPIALISGASSYCSGSLLHLSTNQGYVYDWQVDAQPLDDDYSSIGTTGFQLEFGVEVVDAGNYIVVATDTVTGCQSSSVPFEVTVFPSPEQPTITANGNEPLCNSQVWTLSIADPNPGIAYAWNTGQVGLSIAAAAAADYQATASNSYGCQSTSDTITIFPAPILEGLPTGCYLQCSTLMPLSLSAPTGFDTYEWYSQPEDYLIGQGEDLTVEGAGNYSLVVSNEHGCTAQSEWIGISLYDCCSTFVGQNSVVPPLCFNGTDGSITATASGGLEPYSFVWDTGDSSATAFGLSGGSYNVTIADQNRCLVHLEDTLVAPALLTASFVPGVLACANDSAEIEVFGSGGTLPYSGDGIYLLPAGQHELFVTDAHGCNTSILVEMVAPEPLVVEVNGGEIGCQGDSASVLVSAAGGIPPYIGTGTFLVGTGPHVFVVTDANGCTMSVTRTFEPTSTLAAHVSFDSIPCHGGLTTISLFASGGIPPYTGQGTFTVGAGAYTYLVGDATGCTDSIHVTVPEPEVLTLGASASSILCHGGTALVTVTALGGTAPYTGTGSFPATAGSHTYVVTDANGCTATAEITLTEPNELTVTATAAPITCHGGSTTVTVSANGGTAPYTGTGSFPATAGTHTYIVTDANGCTSANSFTITEPALLAGSGVLSQYACGFNISCNGASNGAVDYSVVGGQAPYTYLWSNGATTQDISGRPPGTYSVTVTDANGCTTSNSFTLIQPTPLAVTSTPVVEFTPRVNAVCGYNVHCFGGNDGQFTVNFAGGASCTASTVVITGPVTQTQTGIGSVTFSNLFAGTYTILVTDANGCTASAPSVTLTQPSPLVANAGPDRAVNFGYQSQHCVVLTGTRSGGISPYVGRWNIGSATGPLVSNNTSVQVCPTVTTTYCYTVTDDFGCSMTDCMTICVTNIRCGTAPTRVNVCTVPPNNPGNPQTLCIPNGQVPAHLAANPGSYMGSCGAVPCSNNKTDGGSSAAAFEENGAGLYVTAFPNPFSDATTLRFKLGAYDEVSAKVYSMTGVLVATLFEGQAEDGMNYDLEFRPEGMANGVYLAKVVTKGGEVKVQKLILNK